MNISLVRTGHFIAATLLDVLRALGRALEQLMPQPERALIPIPVRQDERRKPRR